MKRLLVLIAILLCFTGQAWASPSWKCNGTYLAGTGNISLIAGSAYWPSCASNGDIQVLFIETKYPDDIPAPGSWTAGGTGWTEVTNSPQYVSGCSGSQDTQISVFWKRKSGGDTTITISDPGDHFVLVMMAIGGAVTSGNPFDVTAGDSVSTATTSVSIPGTSTTVTDTLIVAAASDGYALQSASHVGSWVNSNLTNAAERFDQGVKITGKGGGLSIATGNWATTGDYGATTATLVNSACQARISIAFKSPEPPNYKECFSTSGTATPGSNAYCGNANCTDGTEYCYPACGSAPCWTEVGATANGDYVSGNERLRVTATGTDAVQTYLSYGSDYTDTYMTFWLKIEGTGTTPSGTLAAGNYRLVANLAYSDGSAAAGLRMLNNSGTYTLDFFFYCEGGNRVTLGTGTCVGTASSLSTSTYNWVNKWILVKLKYVNPTGTENDKAGWEIYDAYGVQLVSQEYALTGTLKAGVSRYGLGWTTTNTITGTAAAQYDNLNVNSLGWYVNSFSFGVCGTESCSSLSGTQCSNYDTCTCENSAGSSYEWPGSTKYDGTKYAECGTSADARRAFPQTDPSVVSLYQNSALETTDMTALDKTQLEYAVDYVQAMTPSRMVKILNADADTSLKDNSRLIKDGSFDGVQIVNLYRTGTDSYTLKQQEISLSGESYIQIDADSYRWYGTKFVATETFLLSKIDLKLLRGSDTSGNIKIYVILDGTPLINLGASITIPRSSIPYPTADYLSFYFPSPIYIKDGLSYWIVTEVDGNYLTWWYVNTDGVTEVIKKNTSLNLTPATWTSVSTTQTGMYKTYALDLDTDNGLFTFIFPPNFNSSRSEKYPIFYRSLALNNTINAGLYTGDNLSRTLVLKNIVKSVEDGGTGIIGVIGNAGGQVNYVVNDEWLDAWNTAIQYLVSWFNADKDKIVIQGGSRGGAEALILTANPHSHDYTVSALFASGGPTAIGQHSKAEDAVWPGVQGVYVWGTGYLAYPNSTQANLTWKYSSQLPPHCTSISDCGDSYHAVLYPFAGTTVVSTADALFPIAYCTVGNCTTYFGNDSKHIVLSYGTHDATIPLYVFMLFDQNMREAGVDHKSCLTFRGGHTGESTACILSAIEPYLNGYFKCVNLLGSCSTGCCSQTPPSKPNGREYWMSETDSHDSELVECYGCEGGAVGCNAECPSGRDLDLPFIAIVPSVVDSDIDANENCTAEDDPYDCCTGSEAGTCDSGHPYDGSQQPAQIMVAGENGQTWAVEILDDNNDVCTDVDDPLDCCTGLDAGFCGKSFDPKKQYYGVFGTNSCGSGCTCQMYGDEWCVISNVQFSCDSPPCKRFYSFVFKGTPVSSAWSPWYGKEAYTCVQTTQYTVSEMIKELSDVTGDYCDGSLSGSDTYSLSMGITQLPSCPNGVCETWEDIVQCPEDCTPGYGHGLFRGIMRGVR